MNSLRQTVAEQMVRIHRISPELAAYHVRQMAPKEVKERFLFYVRSIHRVSGPVVHVAQRAIGNLTIPGMENRAGKNVPMLGVESFLGSGATPQKVGGGNAPGKEQKSVSFPGSVLLLILILTLRSRLSG